MRPDAVAQLVRQNVHEEILETEIFLVARRQHARGDGHQNAVELGFLNVLQHDALAALFLHHSLVVGQIESRCPHTMGAIAGRQDFVHHTYRRRRAQFGITVARVNRQVVLHFLQAPGELLEMAGLPVVADGDVRFEGRLIPE